PVRDGLGVVVAGPVAEARPRLIDLVSAEAKRRGALPPDHEPPDALALAAEGALEREGATQNLGVERPGEAAVAGDRDDRDGLDLARLKKRQPAEGGAGPRGAG